ncbi:TAR DNA-binding protein 43-like [Ctenocephalides felis]|uniref:TAR DNA-binding protein 43-like n=1 Tax=Ctenocephalides felis TaxID=7515 RepID=UPI000E6E29B4|nr:TAR DNA-binding protein 43-like [Ctenocephalides felis]
MPVEYVCVVEDEGDEPIELPTEEDGTLLLSTLTAQFPGSCGLKYRHSESKFIRGVRLVDGCMHPPMADGWDNETYICVFPKENKRKSNHSVESSTVKSKRIESHLRCTDLIVLSLPWKSTDKDLREYFETFGEVLMAQVKKDPKSGQSKGYGFVRMASYDAQRRILSQRHMIDGRWCEVRVPNSKEGRIQQMPCKVFVGKCTEDLTADDLQEYFSSFGEVTDVFIPKPFRAFSFVTFLDPDVAQSLCGEDHIIKGVSVHISNAAPKSDQNRNFNNGQNTNQANNRVGTNDSYYNQQNNSWPSGQRSNIDMPNLQNLGINSQGQNSRTMPPAQNMQNPMGMGTMNVNALPLNPAVVAAALNQAGWGLIGNMQQQQSRQEPSGYPSSSVGSNTMTTPQQQQQSGNYNWMAQASNTDHMNQQRGNQTWAGQGIPTHMSHDIKTSAYKYEN